MRDGDRPRLARGVRLRAPGGARTEPCLLYPEGLLELSSTAFAVLERCDGARTVAEIAQELESRYEGGGAEEIRADARALLAELAARRLVEAT